MVGLFVDKSPSSRTHIAEGWTVTTVTTMFLNVKLLSTTDQIFL